MFKEKHKPVTVTYSDGSKYLNAEGNTVTVDFPAFEYTDLMQSFFYSVAKLVREHPARKVILLFDKSPYVRTQMVKDYKSSRVYYTDSDLEKLTQDDNPVKYFQVQSNVEFNKIKNHAKYSICSYFPKFGMPIFIVLGLEADDLAYIAARNCKDLSEKVAICSVDSDWRYRINPNCDVITPKGKVITYEEMIKTIPEGWDLYQYHKYNDTFFGGHNDLHLTLTELGKNKSIDELKSAVEDGKSEYFTDIDLVKVQLKTFDIDEFEITPSIVEAMSDENLEKLGGYYTDYDKFSKDCFFKIGYKYYSRFLDSLDLKLYSKLN
jgi:hypothetical protein